MVSYADKIIVNEEGVVVKRSHAEGSTAKETRRAVGVATRSAGVDLDAGGLEL